MVIAQVKDLDLAGPSCCCSQTVHDSPAGSELHAWPVALSFLIVESLLECKLLPTELQIPVMTMKVPVTFLLLALFSQENFRSDTFRLDLIYICGVYSKRTCHDMKSKTIYTSYSYLSGGEEKITSYF